MKKIKEKIEFFWDYCMPGWDDEITESIREKTFRKIKESGNGSRLLSPGREKGIKRLRIAIVSVAASVAILFVSVYSLRNFSKEKEMMEIVAMMEQLSSEESDQVILMLSDSEKLQLATDAQISYTAKGKVSVDQIDLLATPQKPAEKSASYPESYNQLIVPKGKRSRILFSDGTRAWVNAGTKVIYPRVFTDEKRVIYVDGEVYLEVTPQADRPFYVNTDGFEIKVLGTSFDVFAYKQNPVRQVALVKGAVEIKDRHNQLIQMAPNELVSLEQDHITEKKIVNAEDYKAWIDNVMILNGESLAHLAERLSLLYGVKIVCDSSLENEQVYGKFDLRDHYEDIIDYIKLMIPLSVHKENGIIYLKSE